MKVEDERKKEGMKKLNKQEKNDRLASMCEGGSSVGARVNERRGRRKKSKRKAKNESKPNLNAHELVLLVYYNARNTHGHTEKSHDGSKIVKLNKECAHNEVDGGQGMLLLLLHHSRKRTFDIKI
jgi:hypothetical protein